MKKLLAVLLIAFITCVNAANVDAANKKTRRTGTRTTTATTGKTSTGISIHTFCKYDNTNRKAGRAIVLMDTAEIFNNLRAAGYRLDKIAEGNVSYSSPWTRCKQHKTDYHWFVGPDPDDLVVIRPGRIEILFKKDSDSKKFIDSCTKMGYKWDSDDGDSAYYYDNYNDSEFGTIIQDKTNYGCGYSSIFIWDKANH